MGIDMDRFYGQSAHGVTQGAFAILNTLQGKPEHIIAAPAMFFLLACQRYHIRPTLALEAAGRMLNDFTKADEGGHVSAVKRALEDREMMGGEGIRDDV